MKTYTNNTDAKNQGLLPAGLTFLIAIIFLSSCTANAGYRHNNFGAVSSTSFEYHYFPDAHVYYDTHRRMYHYHHKQHGWLSVKQLPPYIHLDRHQRHLLRSGHQTPWNNQHLYKKNRSHFNSKHNDQSSRRHKSPGEHRPQHRNKASHTGDNRPHEKDKVFENNRHLRNRTNLFHKDHRENNPVSKAPDRRRNYQQTPAGKQTGGKILRQGKSTRHRKVSGQANNRHARSDLRERQGDRIKRY